MSCNSSLRLWSSFSGISLSVVLLDDSPWTSRCSLLLVRGSASTSVPSVFQFARPNPQEEDWGSPPVQYFALHHTFSDLLRYLCFVFCYLLLDGVGDLGCKDVCCYIKQGFCTCKLDDYVSIVLVQHIRTDTLHCSPSLVVDLQTCINFIYQLESSPDPSMLFILFDILCLQHGQSRFYTCTVYIYMQYMLYNIRPYIRFCVGIQRKKPASALPHIALTNAPLLRDGTKVHSLRC